MAKATVTFLPLDEATGVTTASPTITLTFDQAVRNLDDSAIVTADLYSKLAFKTTDKDGTNVPYTATINEAKKVITIIPTGDLKVKQLYYLAVLKDSFENESDEVTDAVSVTWTTSDTTALTGTVISANSIVSKAFVTGDVDGNLLTLPARDENMIIVVYNSGSSARVVKVKAPVLKNFSSSLADLEKSIPAGEVGIINIESAFYADKNGLVNIDVAHAEVKIAEFYKK